VEDWIFIVKMEKELENKPCVSVILTTFNRAKIFLPRAINSVLTQTSKDFELIIIDDASTDDTEKVVKSFKDKRIKYIKHIKNFGSDTRGKNEGILASKGRYLAYLDDDNEWLPYHLEKLLEKLKNNPELDLVYCDMWMYDSSRPKWEGQQGIAMDFDGQFLLNRCFIDTSEVVHKREWAFMTGGFDESLEKFIDWNMWVRIMKAGANMQRVPIIASNYYLNPKQKSSRIKSKGWVDPETGMTMFEPSFKPSSCYIHQDWLYKLDSKNKEVLTHKEQETKPKVAIFTITYDRLDYTKRMFKSLTKSTEYPWDWFVHDNGSKDKTLDFLEGKTKGLSFSSENSGLTAASNNLIDKIFNTGNYQIIIKADNDCEFMTHGWLETQIDLWKMNHLLYMSPYPEGMVDNPGGAPRIGYSTIGPYFIEVAYHLSGLCAMIDAKAYKNFRWKDKFLHGNQDREASIAFGKLRYMPCHVPLHRVMHQQTTAGQHKKYPAYFKRRVEEKKTQV